MKNSKLALVLSVAMAVGIMAPSMADTKTGGVSTNAGLETTVNGSLLVPRVGAAGVAAVVGTPVAAVRQTYKYYTTWTPQWADKIGMGGHDCGPCCAVVSLVSVPASLLMGTAMGICYGTKNGVVKGFNAPFSPASFCLDKDYEK